MLVYLAFDRKTGKVVHMHRAVDGSGRGLACSEDEVRAALPESIRSTDVEITQAEVDAAPSSRETEWTVDVATRRLRATPIATSTRPARTSTRQRTTSRKRG
jgi:hypothetical protein